MRPLEKDQVLAWRPLSMVVTSLLWSPDSAVLFRYLSKTRKLISEIANSEGSIVSCL